jgi:hypothetical protein
MRVFQIIPGHGLKMIRRRSPQRLLHIVLLLLPPVLVLPPPVQRLQLRQCRTVLGLLAARQLTRMLTPSLGTTGPGSSTIWVPRGGHLMWVHQFNFMYDPLGDKFHLQVSIRRGQTLGRVATPMVQDIRFMVANRDEETRRDCEFGVAYLRALVLVFASLRERPDGGGAKNPGAYVLCTQ